MTIVLNMYILVAGRRDGVWTCILYMYKETDLFRSDLRAKNSEMLSIDTQATIKQYMLLFLILTV